MSKFKHAALALATAGLLSAQAHAGEAQVQSQPAMPVAAFSQSDISGMFDQAGQSMQLAALSGQEMMETEGAIAPLVAIGVVHGGRFIVQRMVTQRMAVQTLRTAQTRTGLNPTFGTMSQNAQQARAISNQVWGRQNTITHTRQNHSHANFSHYQGASNRSVGHSYYRSGR